MIRSIYKYSLSIISGPQSVEMPVGAKVIKIAPQNNRVCIWAIVDTHPNASKMWFTYQIIGTGYPIPDDATYVETVFVDQYVGHVFKLEDGYIR